MWKQLLPVSDTLSLISNTCMVEWENSLPNIVLWPLQVGQGMSKPRCMHANAHIQNKQIKCNNIWSLASSSEYMNMKRPRAGLGPVIWTEYLGFFIYIVLLLIVIILPGLFCSYLFIKLLLPSKLYYKVLWKKYIAKYYLWWNAPPWEETAQWTKADTWK